MQSPQCSSEPQIIPVSNTRRIPCKSNDQSPNRKNTKLTAAVDMHLLLRTARKSLNIAFSSLNTTSSNFLFHANRPSSSTRRNFNITTYFHQTVVASKQIPIRNHLINTAKFLVNTWQKALFHDHSLQEVTTMYCTVLSTTSHRQAPDQLAWWMRARHATVEQTYWISADAQKPGVKHMPSDQAHPILLFFPKMAGVVESQ